MKIKEMLNEALPLLEEYAPSVIASINGPAGLALGAALPLLEKAFGSGAGNLSGLAGAIINDPNAKEKLATINLEHETWMANFPHQLPFPMPSTAEINIKLSWDNLGVNDH